MIFAYFIVILTFLSYVLAVILFGFSVSSLLTIIPIWRSSTKHKTGYVYSLLISCTLIVSLLYTGWFISILKKSSTHAYEHLKSDQAEQRSTTDFGAFTTTSSPNLKYNSPALVELPDGTVLVSGFYEVYRHPIDKRAEIYNPKTKEFEFTGEMGIPRLRHTATLLPSGKVLIAGGSPIGSSLTQVLEAEIYDPITKEFRLTGKMHTSSLGHTAILLPNGKVYVAGGDVDNIDIRRMHKESVITYEELYDPTNETFTVVSKLNETIKNYSVAPLPNGNVIILGGFSASRDVDRVINPDIRVFDYKTEKTEVVGKWEHPFDIERILPLANGNLLIIPNILYPKRTEPTPPVVIYDHQKHTFSDLKPLAFKSSHCPVLLKNGKVLLLNTELNNVELLDPLTNDFTLLKAKAELRRSGALSALQMSNGQVLIIGGENNTHKISYPELFTY